MVRYVVVEFAYWVLWDFKSTTQPTPNLTRCLFYEIKHHDISCKELLFTKVLFFCVCVKLHHIFPQNSALVEPILLWPLLYLFCIKREGYYNINSNITYRIQKGLLRVCSKSVVCHTSVDTHIFHPCNFMDNQVTIGCSLEDDTLKRIFYTEFLSCHHNFSYKYLTS